MIFFKYNISYYRNHLEPSEYDSPSRMYGRLHFTLLSHPTMRYRRYVVNDFLDVIGKRLIIVIDSIIIQLFNIVETKIFFLHLHIFLNSFFPLSVLLLNKFSSGNKGIRKTSTLIRVLHKVCK